MTAAMPFGTGVEQSRLHTLHDQRPSSSATTPMSVKTILAAGVDVSNDSDKLT